MTIHRYKNKEGRVYFQKDGSHLRFSTRTVAERHHRIADENKANFRAAITANTAEEREANMRAFFRIGAAS